jgi:hypothetical protein
MQYILSEEEYKALKTDADRGRRLEGHQTVHLSRKKLQELCTKIADTMPVKWGWGKPDDPKPWGCVITAEKKAEEEGYHDEWYCDKCPVQDLCPYEGKSYSK